ncbi:Type III secretion system ATPase [gamma proteobacterium HdN1]|nr:Type III secretion system ATPase [gamma proteobacterium HdN1]
MSELLLDVLNRIEPRVYTGRVVEAWGTLIHVTGVPAKIGDICRLRDPANGNELLAEAVGIKHHITLLNPLGTMEGVSNTMLVEVIEGASTVPVGRELLGRVLDSQGLPLDGKPPPNCAHRAAIYAAAPDPMKRLPVDKAFSTGVQAIDSMLTLGLGQRAGIFAMAGGGKSTLLGMLARGSESDVNVVVLIGERGREVREFIDESLGAEGLAKSVVLVSTSDRPALERCRVALVGTAIAEYFRDKGLRVLLMMDSVTRYARALRDIGLALGEPPVRRGFTPSVFSQLPRLFERAGNNEKGYITGIYTVLAEDEHDGEDPVTEEVRSLLDGHIVLSRKLAAAAHYPAIDVLASASRVMHNVTTPEHRQKAARVRALMSKYKEVELLLQVGEYKKGTDGQADDAIRAAPMIGGLLKQDSTVVTPYARTLELLERAVS